MFSLVGNIVDKALQPVRDVASVTEGLLEGEIREDAASRLITEAAAGLLLGAVISNLSDD